MRQEIYAEIEKERLRQNEKWGEQNHPIRIETDQAVRGYKIDAECCKENCEMASMNDSLTWDEILREEVAEIFAADDPEEQIKELIQTAAVCVQMIECIQRNRK